MTAHILFFTVTLLLFPVQGKTQEVSSAMKTQQASQKAAAQSQQRIDKLDDETKTLLNEYLSAQDSLDDLQAYNEQLARQLRDQEAEIARLESEREAIEQTRRHTVPFMMQMLEVFGQSIQLGAPFLQEERQMRLKQLQELMDRADVSLAEKFRRLLEGYRVEAEYGHSLETYQSELVTDKARTVDFLRLGRVGLYYLTLDGSEAGFWNRQQTSWQRLDDQYRDAIKQGILIARKQLPPDLIRLPFTAPEDAQ
ncbi:DUF3450 domain-containing protein [Thiomicrorhabdus sp.]|uniref:DUF3450 domain-containing protein n=1 Tax=Thiomicrorhabdus sp. TaxID=2039724 RepID=UPI0029C90AE4|nr:DUF3450 domain-containing protein [Thiomicrorhabdus sp.]